MRVVEIGLTPARPSFPRMETCEECKARVELDLEDVRRFGGAQAYDEQNVWRDYVHKFIWSCVRCSRRNTFVHIAYEGDESTVFCVYKDRTLPHARLFRWDDTRVVKPQPPKPLGFFDKLRKGLSWN